MIINRLKGMRDLFGEDLAKIRFVMDLAYQIAVSYGFKPLDTPILEPSEMFETALGSSSDIVNKEMYSFVDRGSKNLTLRPEFTASVSRAFCNNMMHLPKPSKWFSSGPVFRHERPQLCRYRQFNQINYEIIGANDFFSDAEAILAADAILKKLSINYSLEINSLGNKETMENYRKDLLQYLSKNKNSISEASVARLEYNPLRILDSKDPLDIETCANAPHISRYYNESSLDFFQNLLKILDELEIKYTINPKLVRGLDYYSHTIFEFTTTELGSQNAILAGGRYNSLIKDFGGPDLYSVGFAGGVERICQLMKIDIKNEEPNIAILPITESCYIPALKIANDLRKQEFAIIFEHKGSIKKRISKYSHCKIVLILGEKELNQNNIIIKNMITGEEKVSKIDAITDMIIKETL